MSKGIVFVFFVLYLVFGSWLVLNRLIVDCSVGFSLKCFYIRCFDKVCESLCFYDYEVCNSSICRVVVYL